MKTKTQNQGKKACDEALKYIHCMEKELEYWLKEKRIYYVERAIRAMDINTKFAGTMHLEDLGMCWNPSSSEMMDAMYEEDEDIVYELVDDVEFEEDEDEEVIAG